MCHSQSVSIAGCKFLVTFQILTVATVTIIACWYVSVLSGVYNEPLVHI